MPAPKPPLTPPAPPADDSLPRSLDPQAGARRPAEDIELLEPEHQGGGMQVTLRPRGVGRLFQAAFLCVWMGGWAMGMWFALGLFTSALEAVYGPGALPASLHFGAGPTVSRAEAPMVFTFLLPWLGLWTMGGALALGQALLLLFGREVVRWGPDGLEIERHALVRIS